MGEDLIEKYVLIQKRGKTYKCQFCEHTFVQKSIMRRHVLSMHERKQTFKCETCDYCFSGKGALDKHIL